jgi:aryl-alcohol dehydrogenase-like predicted oxidoreductase
VAAPIASARTLTQLREILPTLQLQLSDDELDRLTRA